MRLHVALNLFNGEEFLEANLRNLRGHADFITIVWQEISYHGDPADPDLEPLLGRMHRAGLVDHLILFECDPSACGEANETSKRNLGLEQARRVNATHHLDCDVDEFYVGDRLARAKHEVENNGYDTTACVIYEYHKAPIYRCRRPRPDLYAPFIHRVTPRSHYHLGWPSYPVRVDPTRRISPFDRFGLLSEELITMEHFSLVRDDLFRCKVRDALNRRPNLEWRLSAIVNFDPDQYDIVEDTFALGSIGS